MKVEQLPEREQRDYDDLEGSVAWWMRFCASRGHRLVRVVLDPRSAEMARAHPEWMFGVPWTEGPQGGLCEFYWEDAEVA